MLTWLKYSEVVKMLRFFLDERNFDLDQKSINKDDRWLCKVPNEVLRVMHIKFFSTAVVLGVIACEEDVMPSFFFKVALDRTLAST